MRERLALPPGTTPAARNQRQAGVLTELSNRGLKDALFVCCDGLTGLPAAVNSVWPEAVVQTCVVHPLRACQPAGARPAGVRQGHGRWAGVGAGRLRAPVGSPAGGPGDRRGAHGGHALWVDPGFPVPDVCEGPGCCGCTSARRAGTRSTSCSRPTSSPRSATATPTPTPTKRTQRTVTSRVGWCDRPGAELTRRIFRCARWSPGRALDPLRYRTACAFVILLRVAIVSSISQSDLAPPTQQRRHADQADLLR